MTRRNDPVTGRFVFHLSDPVEVEAQCEAYFESLLVDDWREVTRTVEGKLEKVWELIPKCKELPGGVAGLAYHLGLTRQGLIGFMRGADKADEKKAAICHVLARAKARIEARHEQLLFDKDTHKGAAFSLTVNNGWGSGDQDDRAPPPAMDVIAPAPNLLAIPKWGDDPDD